jgi:hypothetical protein
MEGIAVPMPFNKNMGAKKGRRKSPPPASPLSMFFALVSGGEDNERALCFAVLALDSCFPR